MHQSAHKPHKTFRPVAAPPLRKLSTKLIQDELPKVARDGEMVRLVMLHDGVLKIVPGIDVPDPLARLWHPIPEQAGRRHIWIVQGNGHVLNYAFAPFALWGAD